MKLRSPSTAIATLLLPVAFALAGVPQLMAQEESPANLTGPITGGGWDRPFGGFTPDRVPAGYVEEEWFLSGTARSYTKVGAWTAAGLWDVEPDEAAAYAVRILVRRPASPGSFNGTVVVEWLNVTARSENAVDYVSMEDELLREGYAWVGVGAQVVGIHAPGTGLKAWDPVRYEPLSHPGDRFSYDIFSAAARALRRPGEGDHPLAGLDVRHLLAMGRSQSAFRLVTYLNAIHPTTRLFDGFLLHSRGASAAGLRAEGMTRDEVPIPPGARVRTDTDVPVLDLQAEGDMTALRSHLTRQEPGPFYRRWEVAGAAHADVPMWVVEVPPGPAMGPGCAAPVNAAPHHAVAKAALRALADWLREGRVPGQPADIELHDPAAADPVVRDEFGNARGGIRLPHVEAPTATVDGIENAPANPGPGMQSFCSLFGRTRPFEESVLRELYPTHEVFVQRYVATVDALERSGYFLAPEAEEARRAARNSRIGRW